MAQVSKIRFFISSSMGEEVPVELRTVLKALSSRYELFEFEFIESGATPAHLQDQMKRMINQTDALIMIFHKLETRLAKQLKKDAEAKGGVTPGTGIVKEGVEFELQHALAKQRPIFLFTEKKFMEHAASSAYLRNVWLQASLSSKEFYTSQDCATAIEQSVFDYIVRATKERLEADGQSRLSSTGQAPMTDIAGDRNV